MEHAAPSLLRVIVPQQKQHILLYIFQNWPFSPSIACSSCYKLFFILHTLTHTHILSSVLWPNLAIHYYWYGHQLRSAKAKCSEKWQVSNFLSKWLFLGPLASQFINRICLIMVCKLFSLLWPKYLREIREVLISEVFWHFSPLLPGPWAWTDYHGSKSLWQCKQRPGN